jgi:hypothetical protein
VLRPIIKPKGIDDVPIVTLTLHSTSPDTGAFDLERVAHSLEAELKRVPGTREVRTLGGPGRGVMVEIDPARMAGAGVTVADLRQALQSANLGLPVGDLLQRQPRVAVEPAPSCATRARWPSWWWACAAASRCSCATWPGCATARWCRRPLCLARRQARTAPRRSTRPSRSRSPRSRARTPSTWRNALHGGVEQLRNTVIPADVQVAVTRNYGATANDKAHQADPEAAVRHRVGGGAGVLRAGPARGRHRRHAVVLTLTVTLFASWAWGFTLNRVSLFALIFSIGILVDDAIVVVENIHRHQAAAARQAAGADHPRRGGRGRRPDHPGHADRDRRAAADGLRQRADGPVHEPDPDQRQHGHAAVAGHRLRGHAVAGALVDEGAAGAGTAPAPPPHGLAPASRRLFERASSRRCWTTHAARATALLGWGGRR